MIGTTSMDEVVHDGPVTYRCHYYVVWCTKYRRKVVTSLDPRLDAPPVIGDPGPVDERLAHIIRETCTERGSEVVDLEVRPNTVRLLVSCDPRYGIHKLVHLLKGRSSNLLRQEFPSLKRRLPTLWTVNYFVATVGNDPLDAVKTYVENQRNV